MSDPKYIEFVRVGDIWRINNKRAGDLLGVIVWYPPWRRYTVQPAPDVEFDALCLRDIAAFLDQQTAARKATR